MKIAEIVLEPGPCDFWQNLKQIGVDDVCGVLPQGSDVDWDTTCERPWDYGSLAKVRDQLNGFDLNLAVFEDVSPLARTRLGLPGRDEEIEQFKILVRNLGRLDVPVLVYDWWAGLGWQRTEYAAGGRGRALLSSYRFADQDQVFTPLGRVPAEQLWASLKYFLDAVLPVAEESGVRLAMHPDDPPLQTVRGIDRIMSSIENYYRLLELHPSESNGITFCQGNFALMTNDLPQSIRDLGGTGRICYVHFRDIRGIADDFTETFHNDGQTDMLACMEAYEDIGYHGFMRTDHVPTLTGDRATIAGYSDNARLHAIGYSQGLIEAAYAATRACNQQPGREQTR